MLCKGEGRWEGEADCQIYFAFVNTSGSPPGKGFIAVRNSIEAPGDIVMLGSPVTRVHEVQQLNSLIRYRNIDLLKMIDTYSGRTNDPVCQH